ncbi:Chitin synthase, class 3 [Cladochytrium tenue]|nr:Chitin synthase, class 3 [Cladochytrium tenue]
MPPLWSARAASSTAASIPPSSAATTSARVAEDSNSYATSSSSHRYGDEDYDTRGRLQQDPLAHRRFSTSSSDRYAPPSPSRMPRYSVAAAAATASATTTTSAATRSSASPPYAGQSSSWGRPPQLISFRYAAPLTPVQQGLGPGPQDSGVFIQELQDVGTDTPQDNLVSLARRRLARWDGRRIARVAAGPLRRIRTGLESDHPTTAAKPHAHGDLDLWWWWTVRILTFFVLDSWLRKCGKAKPQVALCMIIAAASAFLGFINFGIPAALCPGGTAIDYSLAVLDQADHRTPVYREDVTVYGFVYPFDDVAAVLAQAGSINLTIDWYGADLSRLFQPDADACAPFRPASQNYSCALQDRIAGSPSLAPAPGQPCPSLSWLDGVAPHGRAYFSWEDVAANSAAPATNSTAPATLLSVFNGAVLNLTDFFGNASSSSSLSSSGVSAASVDADVAEAVRLALGGDATLRLLSSGTSQALAACLHQTFLAGFAEPESAGCVAAYSIQGVAAFLVTFVASARLLLAAIFNCALAPGLIKKGLRTRGLDRPPPFARPHPSMQYAVPLDEPSTPGSGEGGEDGEDGGGEVPRGVALGDPGLRISTADMHPHVILFVTCYSEGADGIRGTLDSLAVADYPDARKLLWVVADGIVVGKGRSVATADLVRDMMEFPDYFPDPVPRQYNAIGKGARRLNRATVYAGFFRDSTDNVIPMVLVAKQGTPEENTDPKPGNRGKRDSQLILMGFLAAVLGDQPITELEHDLYHKILAVTGVSAAVYELVLMVDADTRVAPDAVRLLVSAMADSAVVGVCGETRVANKRASWVTRIQFTVRVFEYFISHHLGKSFESVYGSVTCLPGCFCMYRIKSPKGPNAFFKVPILVNRDIVDEYADRADDTLHKKNLLLLGEDRYLTTLVVKSFPKRKLLFVPQAVCRTIVPDDLQTLMSQRRRWINSTIHNLYELFLMRDLCGVMCVSMRFVVAGDFIGTLVMPAAFVYLMVLLISPIFTGHVSTVALILTISTLGLPGILIVITTRRLSFLYWMLIYLASIPIWNFLLPLYAFWNFDEFSWGETRPVEGEAGSHDASDPIPAEDVAAPLN